MELTVPAAFERLKSNLEISGLQQSTVSTRQTAVRAAVARRLTVNESFLTGSYRRHTMISPLQEADIDVFVVLDVSYYAPTGQAQLLDRVRATLLETYPKTPRISRNGQAVTIRFTDFTVDVVPAFYRNGGGYLIPSTTEQRWIATDPKLHERFITQANTAHGGELIPLIKMVKAWNRKSGRTLRSFYLELLVAKVLSSVTISNAWSGCRFVFDRAREAVKFKIADPAGLDPRHVAGLHGASVAQAQTRLQTAYERARRAEDLANRGQNVSAFAEWRKIFSNYFPAGAS